MNTVFAHEDRMANGLTYPVGPSEPCAAVGEIVDSRFFGNGFGTSEAREVFCDLRRFQRWLDVEVALAEAQAELGMIPEHAAAEIARTGRLDLFDLAAVRRGIAQTGHSLVPLLRAWQAVVASDAGQYIHYGATTQDIQDTAQSLEIRDSLAIIERDFLAVLQDLARLARRHRDLVMVARTHGQYALPTTLGLKISVWLDEGLRNLERLEHCRKQVLVAQLFGGVGTMAAFGDRGLDLIERFAKKLGLEAPDTAWHAARDRIVELLSTLAMLTGSLAKVANEIIALNQNEIGELSEPFIPGQVGSSTMPHKRNPELSERAVALAKLVRSHAALSYDSLIAEHERDYRTVRLEWITVTDSVLYTASALELMHIVLSGLVVNEETIRRHTQVAADQLCSEPLMFCLGSCFGKQTAHQIVYEASMRAHDQRTNVVDELLADGRVASRFERMELEAVVSPDNYVGTAGAMVDRVISKSRRRLARSGLRLGEPVSICKLRDAHGCRVCFPCSEHGVN